MQDISRAPPVLAMLLLLLLLLLVLCAAEPSMASAIPGEEKTLQNEKRNNCSTRPRCKAVPGTPSWPSDADWRRLNESTGGRLLRPAPPGAVCHPGQATYDPTRCSAVRAAWTSHELHVSDPVSSMSNIFNNDTCLPDPADPCSGQGYPVFVINATEVEHVKLGVRFARKHNVRLIVKATGHDFIGRSVAPNSLSIWTHYMKGLERHQGSFRPKGCPASVTIAGGALTARAGTQMGEAYAFTDSFNETIVGGGGLTVGIGGWLTGAGHGLLSPWHGLGVDQVLEMDIVTPEGEALTLNECSNKDLFWAMRGGGGSTFGIMTSATLKTHPTPQIPTLLVYIAATNSSSPEAMAAFPDVAAHVLGDLPRLSAAGAAGYLQIANRYPNPSPDPQPPGQELLTGVAGILTFPYGNASQAAAAWEPLRAHVAAAWPGTFTAVASPEGPYPSFWAWYQVYNDRNPVGGNALLGSWLLDGRALTADRNATAAAVARFVGGAPSGAFLNFIGGRGVMEARPRGGSTAVVPAWRKAYLHPISVASFPPLDPAAKARGVRTLIDRVAALRELAPDMGAYMNEANPYEPNWQAAFWGSNYARLRSIKRSVDPDDVLWCHPCVGNEGWREVGNQLCRV